jgi:nicotinamidase-related amidase
MASVHALVIVDVQQAFPMPQRLVDRIRDYARRFDLRVFTRFVNPDGSVFHLRMGMHICRPGSPDTALRIQPKRGDIVLSKQGYGLTARHLARLKRLGVKKATVCGLETDACVLGVMFTLFDAGIDCRVKPDLCWSSTGLHREGLKIIATQFPPPKK